MLFYWFLIYIIIIYHTHIYTHKYMYIINFNNTYYFLLCSYFFLHISHWEKSRVRHHTRPSCLGSQQRASYDACGEWQQLLLLLQQQQLPLLQQQHSGNFPRGRGPSVGSSPPHKHVAKITSSRVLSSTEQFPMSYHVESMWLGRRATARQEQEQEEEEQQQPDIHEQPPAAITARELR